MSGWGGRRRTRRAGSKVGLGAAVAVVVGLLAVPAFAHVSSQGGAVSNSGGAGAGTGGNSAVGNQSDNTAAASTAGTIGGSLGNLVGVNVTVGPPQNNSSGSAGVATGPATATGNNSAGTVAQGSGGGHGASFQSGSVSNSGRGEANTGGNSAVGNQSTNVATQSQDVSGGLLGVGVIIGGPSNVSDGNATIQTGEARANGNVADGAVTQLNGSGTGLCSPVSKQVADVSNQGEASADTGGNQAVGNASTNVATSTLNGALSGDILGLGITLGGPTNESNGSADIRTGAATAVGNQSAGSVVQENCVPGAARFGAPGAALGFVSLGERQGTTALARTGTAAARLLPFAGLLLALGVLVLRFGPVPAGRRGRG